MKKLWLLAIISLTAITSMAAWGIEQSIPVTGVKLKSETSGADYYTTIWVEKLIITSSDPSGVIEELGKASFIYLFLDGEGEKDGIKLPKQILLYSSTLQEWGDHKLAAYASGPDVIIEVEIPGLGQFFTHWDQKHEKVFLILKDNV